MWDYFDKRVCLTADPNEWLLAEKEFQRVGLKVERFDALPDIGPHQSFNRSTRQILIQFYESNAETLLFLEDDCVFKNYNHLQAAVSEVPKDWDILYLGCNILDEKPARISKHVFEITEAWTTHCVAYSRKVIPFLLENQPGFSEQMFDNWLAGQRVKKYVINPMIAWQRPRISKIWGGVVDYSEHFINSQNKMS